MAAAAPVAQVTTLFPSLAGLDRAMAVIIISEIGDKTFLLAALLAMRHSRLVVFAGAFGALLIMSVLSAALGHVLPTLLPRRYTTLAASVLFVVFGLKMLQEGWAMEGGTGKVEEEIKEVEEELLQREEETKPDLELGMSRPSSPSLTGRSRPSTPAGPRPLSQLNLPSTVPGTPSSPRLLTGVKRRKSSSGGLSQQTPTLLSGIKNLCQLMVSPVLLQTFVMTFLAEWGDRSQISTIALAAAHNVYLVTFGTVLGHSLCTLFAVLGGRWLATKISVKHVTLGGAALFLIFGVMYLYEGLVWDEALQAVEEVREAAGAAAVVGVDLDTAQGQVIRL